MTGTPKMECRCCGSSRLEKVLDLGQQPWGNHFLPMAAEAVAPVYPLDLLVCTDCWMAQISYTVPKEVMFVEHDYVSGTTKSLRRHFEGVAELIKNRVAFGAGDYVLDIGGNDGTFLQSVQHFGIDTLNVESGSRQATLSQQAGVPTLNAFFNAETAADIRRERGPAKVIHGSGVFFHLEELHSVFRGIKELLASDGFVVAEFIYFPGMIEGMAFDQIYHEHLTYYAITTFDRLLARHGLKIVDAELMPIHGGSCIAWITHADTVPESAAVAALRQKEQALGLETLELYRGWADRIAALRDKLVALVHGLRRQGLTIHALGAPVKGSTILNYCGFTTDDIACAVEINELKVGKRVPGAGLPVYHQDRVPPPDAYLLLAWNFREEALARLGDFRAKGGKIIVPLPAPEII